jgi:hypothetical protein
MIHKIFVVIVFSFVLSGCFEQPQTKLDKINSLIEASFSNFDIESINNDHDLSNKLMFFTNETSIMINLEDNSLFITKQLNNESYFFNDPKNSINEGTMDSIDNADDVLSLMVNEYVKNKRFNSYFIYNSKIYLNKKSRKVKSQFNKEISYNLTYLMDSYFANTANVNDNLAFIEDKKLNQSTKMSNYLKNTYNDDLDGKVIFYNDNKLHLFDVKNNNYFKINYVEHANSILHIDYIFADIDSGFTTEFIFDTESSIEIFVSEFLLDFNKRDYRLINKNNSYGMDKNYGSSTSFDKEKKLLDLLLPLVFKHYNETVNTVDQNNKSWEE